MLRRNVHCPQRTWVGHGASGWGWWRSPAESSLLSPSSAATRAAGTSAINATREKMVVKYFMMKKREDAYRYSRGKCDGMKNQLVHLEVVLYKSKNRRMVEILNRLLLILILADSGEMSRWRWNVENSKRPGPVFNFNSSGQRRNIPLAVTLKSFKSIWPRIIDPLWCCSASFRVVAWDK